VSPRAVPGDQAERARAVASPRNLAVTAGAGTGKTTLLVDRILRKVLEEGVAIDRILALTFTEKAANEMRQRLGIELRRARRLEGLERAEIGTIHSFCAHVLRQFPLEAGVAPDVEVDEGPAFRRRFDEAWPRWLDRELGPGARRPKAWKEVLARVELRDLRELAEGLCSFSVPEERGDGRPLLDRFVKDCAARVPKLAPALQGRAAPQKTIKGGPDVQAALRLAQDVAEIDEDLVARAVGLVDGFAREFRRDFLRAGLVSFDGLLLLVRDLLGSTAFPGVLEALRARYACILVDEVQDTDPLQGEILRKLAEGPDGRLVPGKLFLVGDPKQSIYSFRGADIIAYDRLVRRVLDEGGERVVLRTNFRSHGRILDLVNAAFSRVIVENGELQPPYEPLEPAADAEQRFPDPTIEAVLIEEAGADESREMEAQEVAAWIESRRPELACKDVAILLRSLVDVGVYLEALRARGIPYVVEGEKYFYGTTEVIDFVNLLRAVANPHDRIAVAGVLRSPYGAVPDRELYERRRELDYRKPSPWPVFALLKAWNAEAGRTGLGALLDRIFEEGFVLEIARAGYHGEQAVANLLKLRRKAGELESKHGCTLREFLERAVAAVRDLEEEGESPLADEALDAVRILSIHRSKGLEFPVVILPDLHRQKQGRQIPTVRYDGTSGVLGVRLGDRLNAGAAALGHLDREREREEWRRLLYVAVTRAEDLLVLLGSAGAKEESFLGLLLPDLEKHAKVTRKPYVRPPFVPPAPVPEPGPVDWPAFVRTWKDRESRSKPPSRLTTPTRLEEGEETHRLSLRTVGTECHRVLERLDFARPQVPEGTGEEARGILEKFFESKVFRELQGTEVLARELPFVIPRDGRIVQGVIDLVYRKGGKTYVADYKTDTIVRPERHGLIREIYSEAVRRVLKVDPVFQLIYLRQGRAVET
jgi:ATP-dependent helicase/nuclease subunit A